MLNNYLKSHTGTLAIIGAAMSMVLVLVGMLALEQSNNRSTEAQSTMEECIPEQRLDGGVCKASCDSESLFYESCSELKDIPSQCPEGSTEQCRVDLETIDPDAIYKALCCSPNTPTPTETITPTPAQCIGSCEIDGINCKEGEQCNCPDNNVCKLSPSGQGVCVYEGNEETCDLGNPTNETCCCPECIQPTEVPPMEGFSGCSPVTQGQDGEEGCDFEFMDFPDSCPQAGERIMIRILRAGHHCLAVSPTGQEKCDTFSAGDEVEIPVPEGGIYEIRLACLVPIENPDIENSDFDCRKKFSTLCERETPTPTEEVTPTLTNTPTPTPTPGVCVVPRPKIILNCPEECL